MFRIDGFVLLGTPGTRPWGWAPACGEFAETVSPDLAGIDVLFAGLTVRRGCAGCAA